MTAFLLTLKSHPAPKYTNTHILMHHLIQHCGPLYIASLYQFIWKGEKKNPQYSTLLRRIDDNWLNKKFFCINATDL